MSRSYVPLLLLLAGLWGGSYLFITVAVRDFEPTVLMALRMLVAAVPLLVFLALRPGGARGAIRDVRVAARDGLVLGLINGALPFTLIAWGETHVDSGIAAVANATVPIFVALLAIRFRPSERASGARLAGILVGLAGVGVLAGVRPEGGAWAVLGTLAVVLASVSYACGGLYGQWSVSQASGPVLAAASTLYGGLVLLPFALAQLPDRMPGWGPVLALLALALAGTSLAQLVLFRMLHLYGSARTSLVTYLLPPVALAAGAVFLDEPLTLSALAGAVLILTGVALGTGVGEGRRRRAVAEAGS